jgi:hypothetical protein
MTRVVILQSNYIPWKGYFDLINDSDIFVFYDDLQYTKNDWRNRNKIKTARGLQWLTIPVGSSGKRLICDVLLPNNPWKTKHHSLLEESYSRSPFFGDYSKLLESFYVNSSLATLSAFNQTCTKVLAAELGITTSFHDSREFKPQGSKLDRLLDLIKKTGADTYISGSSAKAYIDEERFKQEGIKLIWKDYSGYPEYPQRFPPFEHAVTVLDLLFNVGPEAPQYIWGWREKLSG